MAPLGATPNLPYGVGFLSDFLAACEPGELKGLKVAWSADFGYATVDSEVRQVAEASARRFVELGCTVEDVDPGCIAGGIRPGRRPAGGPRLSGACSGDKSQRLAPPIRRQSRFLWSA